ncbi:aminotransferase class IV [Nocardia jinanensis]|uniref:Branched-chain amino acid aminotransferase n=2 Tax=Nocardia jinanensis TaxID=382504 RepID=A0A917RGM2_9NOCA|nr:aminotransferase class IV [Nocardia jinanensis]GGL06892.1 branched-chain amino acid aminotransferase [Nocardia jinanensis]
MSGLATAGAVAAIWLDGELVDPAEATLPVLSFGLHNAHCVFEGIRVHAGRAFAATEHAERLHTSATAIGMTLPWSVARIEAAIDTAVVAAGCAEAYVRPVAWRGAEMIGIDYSGTSVHLAVGVVRWPTPSGPRPPLRLEISRWQRPAPTMAPAQAKTSASYLVGSLALAQAHDNGYDDALLLDHRGYVAEATGANIFLVTKGELVTPVADTFLDGITRRTVLRLAERMEIPTRVARITLADLADADEVFLTGTASGVAPVAQIADTTYPTTRPRTRALAEAYLQLVHAHRTEETPRIPSA